MKRFILEVFRGAFLYAIVASVLCNHTYMNSRSDISKHHLSFCYSGCYDLYAVSRNYGNDVLPALLRWDVGYKYFPFRRIGFSLFITPCGTALWQAKIKKGNSATPTTYNGNTFVAFGIGCSFGWYGDYGNVKNMKYYGKQLPNVHCASCIHIVCNVDDLPKKFNLGIQLTPLQFVLQFAGGTVKNVYKIRFGYIDLMKLKSASFEEIVWIPTFININIGMGSQIDLDPGVKKRLKKELTTAF